MNIAMIYMLAALLALIVAAPVALLAPVLFAVELPEMLPVTVKDLGHGWEMVSTGSAQHEYRRIANVAEETIVEQGDNDADTVPMADVCAPFVAVYLSRGESRPVAHPWTVCPSRPAVHPLSRNGRPLRGAAMRAATAKANRIACVSHACPMVRL